MDAGGDIITPIMMAQMPRLVIETPQLVKEMPKLLYILACFKFLNWHHYLTGGI